MLCKFKIIIAYCGRYTPGVVVGQLGFPLLVRGKLYFIDHMISARSENTLEVLSRYLEMADTSSSQSDSNITQKIPQSSHYTSAKRKRTGSAANRGG